MSEIGLTGLKSRCQQSQEGPIESFSQDALSLILILQPHRFQFKDTYDFFGLTWIIHINHSISSQLINHLNSI